MVVLELGGQHRLLPRLWLLPGLAVCLVIRMPGSPGSLDSTDRIAIPDTYRQQCSSVPLCTVHFSTSPPFHHLFSLFSASRLSSLDQTCPTTSKCLQSDVCQEAVSLHVYDEITSHIWKCVFRVSSENQISNSVNFPSFDLDFFQFSLTYKLYNSSNFAPLFYKKIKKKPKLPMYQQFIGLKKL